MAGKPDYWYQQVAVAPVLDDGRLVLVTSRGSGRWIVPKGIVEPGFSAIEAGAQEAFEEAGVRGTVDAAPLGVYHRHKWGGACRVELHLMRVGEMLEEWPERGQRQRRVVTLDEALELVSEKGLRDLLAQLPQLKKPPMDTDARRWSLMRPS